MKKNNAKKLDLSTQTVRSLDAKRLDGVGGGQMNNTFLCPVTMRCSVGCTIY